jgi:hypothetical protein
MHTLQCLQSVHKAKALDYESCNRFVMLRNEIINELIYYSNVGHIKNFGGPDVARRP